MNFIGRVALVGSGGGILGWIFLGHEAALVIGSASTLALSVTLASIILQSLRIEDSEEGQSSPSLDPSSSSLGTPF